MFRCLQCNKEFLQRRADALFCSTRCRVAYHRHIKAASGQGADAAKKTILSLCDFTGNWSRPYEEAGYNVIRVDMKDGQDVRLFTVPKQQVHGILAAPPCTVFASSGQRWERTTGEMLEGISIVDACLRIITATIPHFWALENPVGSLRNYIGNPVYYFDPCDYAGYPGGEGDLYTKRTCLWGKFNRPKPRRREPGQGSRMHLQYGGRSERTRTIRSTTPVGFAQAFFEYNK